MFSEQAASVAVCTRSRLVMAATECSDSHEVIAHLKPIESEFGQDWGLALGSTSFKWRCRGARHYSATGACLHLWLFAVHRANFWLLQCGLASALFVTNINQRYMLDSNNNITISGGSGVLWL